MSNDLNVIVNDTSGSVFLLDTRKKLFDPRCIFSGSRGEALLLSPLERNKIPKNSLYKGLDNLCLTAMATVSKIIVISIKPTMTVHFTTDLQVNIWLRSIKFIKSIEFIYLKGDLFSLPSISWNLYHRNVISNEFLPLLMFGRHNQLLIHQVDYQLILIIYTFQSITDDY